MVKLKTIIYLLLLFKKKINNLLISKFNISILYDEETTNFKDQIDCCYSFC